VKVAEERECLLFSSLRERVPEGWERVWPKPLNFTYKVKAVKRKIKSV